MLLSDTEILRAAREGLIEPCVAESVRSLKGQPAISFGPSSYGYDLRCQPHFRVFREASLGSPYERDVDPKAFDEGLLEDVHADYVWVPAHSYVLGVTVERLQMPNDLTGLVIGKSTYARCGLSVSVTPIQAGFTGYVVLEWSNGTPNRIKLYAHEGCAHLILFRGDQPCERPYRGLYQNQFGVTPAKVK